MESDFTNGDNIRAIDGGSVGFEWGEGFLQVRVIYKVVMRNAGGGASGVCQDMATTPVKENLKHGSPFWGRIGGLMIINAAKFIINGRAIYRFSFWLADFSLPCS